MHRYSNFTRRLPERRRAVAIYGPTSSGKTALSLDVCDAASERGLRPVVLNADSRQVMPAWTSARARSSRRRCEDSSTACWTWPSRRRSCRWRRTHRWRETQLASLAASGNALPALVGGTGVYVQSVLDGRDLTGTGTLRRSLERDFPRSDVKGAYHVLARLTPEAARRVHPNNYEGAPLNALGTLLGRPGG